VRRRESKNTGMDKQNIEEKRDVLREREMDQAIDLQTGRVYQNKGVQKYLPHSKINEFVGHILSKAAAMDALQERMMEGARQINTEDERRYETHQQSPTRDSSPDRKWMRTGGNESALLSTSTTPLTREMKDSMNNKEAIGSRLDVKKGVTRAQVHQGHAPQNAPPERDGPTQADGQLRHINQLELDSTEEEEEQVIKEGKKEIHTTKEQINRSQKGIQGSKSPPAGQEKTGRPLKSMIKFRVEDDQNSGLQNINEGIASKQNNKHATKDEEEEEDSYASSEDVSEEEGRDDKRTSTYE
jgi:hypothetical protein